MHFAVKSKSSPDIIDTLLHAGVDSQAQNADGKASRGLGQEGFALSDWNTDQFFQTAVVGDVHRCLKSGSDPHICDHFGRTPLHIAAAHSQYPEIIKALLAASADVKARDKNGRTPLHAAAQNAQSPEIMTVLLHAGADAKARDMDGETALHLAVRTDKPLAMIKVLLAASADANARNKEGWTPFHVAVKSNSSPDVIDALLHACGKSFGVVLLEILPR